jgi:membrane-associated protease RseP (regulator of RpoE activity)
MRSHTWKRLMAASVLVAAPQSLIGVSRAQQATAADENAEGRIVEISPSERDETPSADNEQQPAEAPKYWIGLQGRPIDSSALRTHLQLADDVGVLVENVIPDSPAGKAGLRQHDVILAVNGEPISSLMALQKVVSVGADKPIELKLIRLAKEMKVSVTPEARPANAVQSLPGAGNPGLGGPMNDIEGMLRQFQGGELPGGVRVFGPGMVFGGQAFDLNKMPNGLSVSITRQGEGAAEITVKKGDETWTLKSDDEEAIKKLPEDVRTFVEQMLEGSRPGQPGQAGAMRFNFGDLQQLMPEGLGQFDAQGLFGVDQEAIRKQAEAARKRTEKSREQLLDRIEQMEERMRELQEQLQENSPAPRTNDKDDSSKT